MDITSWPCTGADRRRGALIPIAACLVAVAGVIAAATGVRERAVRRAGVQAADLGQLVDAAESAQVEATVYLRENLEGGHRAECAGNWREKLRATLAGAPLEADRVSPSRTRRACARDAPWLSVGEVTVKLVRATRTLDIAAGAAPHGVLEMAVRVESQRGGGRTLRQRRLFVVTAHGRRMTLVGDPLGAVLE